MDKGLSFNPPEAPSDHWQANTPLPKYDRCYTLKRVRGVTHVLDENGQIPEQLAPFYVKREEFLADTDALTLMIADGPL